MGPMGNNLTERTQLETSRVQMTLPGIADIPTAATQPEGRG